MRTTLGENMILENLDGIYDDIDDDDDNDNDNDELLHSPSLKSSLGEDFLSLFAQGR